MVTRVVALFISFAFPNPRRRDPAREQVPSGFASPLLGQFSRLGRTAVLQPLRVCLNDKGKVRAACPLVNVPMLDAHDVIAARAVDTLAITGVHDSHGEFALNCLRHVHKVMRLKLEALGGRSLV